MSKPTDIRAVEAALYLLPASLRMPLKFGAETINALTIARVRLTVRDRQGTRAEGWGETPLSVTWVWPSALGFEERLEAMLDFCHRLTDAWATFGMMGHPIEVGHAFQHRELKELLETFNSDRDDADPMPWLAALVCCSMFDSALHDAYGVLHEVPVYETYNERWMNRDLAAFLTPENGCSFKGRYPSDFLTKRRSILPVWHLVGGSDPVTAAELTGHEPEDGYPVLLTDWIECDGLRCLKVKLAGNDAASDYQRLLAIGEVALATGVHWLTTDFNCQVKDPAYVNEILDRLMIEHPRLYGMILYVEQPFPYELEEHQIDVHSVSARKPLFMDESAHGWEQIRLGRSLGWTGVALKTCKTQTGALLSLCWAKAHGMTLMVQDLTNPMLAQVSHLLLAAHAGTIMGVESNAMQFCPDASRAEASVHPGLYARRDGVLDLNSISGPGYGYRLQEIERELPPPSASSG